MTTRTPILLLLTLAAALVVGAGCRNESARVAKAKAETKALYDAVVTYNARHGEYPESLDALADEDTRVVPWRKIPKDPWGNDYYLDDGDLGFSADFWIVSFGADGEYGGDGPDKDIAYPPDYD